MSESTGATALSVAEAARVRAVLDQAQDPAAIFQDQPMSRELWMAAEERLLAELAEEVDRGDLARMEEYKRIYGAIRAEGDRAPASNAAEPIDGPPTSRDAAPASMPKVQVVQATFQQQVAPAPFDPDATAEADARAIIAGLRNRGVPFEQPARAAPPPQALPADPDARSGETQAMNLSVLQGLSRVVPFDQRAAQPQPQPRTQVFDPDETGMVDASELLAGLRSGGVPFKQGPAAPPPPRAPEPPPRSPGRDQPDEHDSGTVTEELDPALFRRLRAIPFEAGGDADPKDPKERP